MERIVPTKQATSDQRFSQKNLIMLSFGGGPPSVALLVLNAQGIVKPKADVIIFADPGAEHPDTYKYLPAYKEYADKHEMRFYSIWDNRKKEGDLLWWLRNKSNSIPLFIKGKDAIGRRQCTVSAKVRVINRFMRNEYKAKTFTTQLAMTREEIFRMKPARQRYITNIYPLVHLGINREECHKIVEDANLPIPPRSACTFCPFQTWDRWVELADNHPREFEKAEEIEKICTKRSLDAGRSETYLTPLMIPLREAVEVVRSGKSLEDGSDPATMECAGNCFT